MAAIERPDPFHRANSLPDLLAFNDVDFVRCAYVTILGRQPDSSGQEHFAQELKRGASKLGILARLRFSPEALTHDPGIAGLDKALRRYQRANQGPFHALLGRFLRTERETEAQRRLRALEQGIARVERDLEAPPWLSRIESLHNAIANIKVDTAVSQGKSSRGSAVKAIARADAPVMALDAQFSPRARHAYRHFSKIIQLGSAH